MANATSERVGGIAGAQSQAKAQSASQSRDHTASQSSRIHAAVLPSSRLVILFRSARSFNQRRAVFREHSTQSATSFVPATPPSSRRASRKSSSDHEGVYRPVSSSRSGGTDCMLIPLSYGAYGIIVPSIDTTANFMPLSMERQGAAPGPLGARERVRVKTPPGPGFASSEPMNVYEHSRLESAGFCALSSATTIKRASVSDGGQPGPQQDARDHRGEVA
jgi:hypothetical protein